MNIKERIQKQALLTLAHHDFDKGLNNYAFFKLQNKATSQDLVQDTFLKTWAYIVKGGKIELMRAFLFHVLNNLIVDEYRKHKTTSLDVLLENGFEPKAENSENFLDILDGQTAFLLIQRLPQKYQRVMRMRYRQSLSLQEISLITGQSKNTIAVQLYRGLEKLKILYNHTA